MTAVPPVRLQTSSAADGRKGGKVAILTFSHSRGKTSSVTAVIIQQYTPAVPESTYQ